MSKMKHFLRKLHIGGGSGGGALADHPHQHHHHHHHRRPASDPSPPRQQETIYLQQQLSPSALSSQTASSVGPALESSENSSNGVSSADVADFMLTEEEYQVQLALAISVSDPDSREDPETTAQIKAAKQISLGCSPSQSLVDFLSLRYWSFNVVNYDEKVMDGFYDAYGINSNLVAQGKMPMLVDLESISSSDNVNYEVILVNRLADVELRNLEEKVHLLLIESRALRLGHITSLLVQKVADIVVDRMGGPVNDAEEMLRKWRARSYELRISLNTTVFPLGCLDVGLSRHRALLFKVLADRINLPCMLVKGSYYTGTDDGAVNLIKFGNGSEYIIDLMGAPGTLIPSEVPSSQFQEIRAVAPFLDAVYDSSFEFGRGTGTVLFTPTKSGALNASSSTPEPSFAGMHFEGDSKTALESKLYEIFEPNLGNIFPSLVGISGRSFGIGHKAEAAKQILAEDISNSVVTAVKNPEFAQNCHTVFFENSALLPPDNSQNLIPHTLGELKMLGKNQFLKVERVVDPMMPSTEEQSHSNVLSNVDIKNLAEGLTVQKQELCSTMSNHVGNFTDSRFLQACGRTDQMIESDDASKGIKEMTNYVHSNSDTATPNEQIAPMLGEVTEWEIPWEDLQIGERIGIGSYGEVYRSEWNGTEVAVKKFMNQDISGDALEQFKCEVEIMLRLRHPNVVLFMGAVTRPPNLSILTEFLPRGSLFKLLHRSNVQIDERRRLRMALDVAKGMNYLHTSHPIIVHRDLKTPNLLVDKNWVVKVCDFGMSRMKHHTFLSSKSIAGTAEWMAPEVLRNEPCNEKSDVFSFGVILWELATLDVPWTGMNSMQVVGAVGFQGRRLKIPDRIDPVVAEIINDCWQSNAHERPSFGQILSRLKSLQCLVVQRTASTGTDELNRQ